MNAHLLADNLALRLPAFPRSLFYVTALLCLFAACGASEESTNERTTTECGSASAESMIQCIDPTSYHQDLERVTGVRTPGSEHWQEVQDLCADRLSELGFSVERQAYGTGVNVIGTLPGTDSAAERVLVSAHYDHIADCPGADDDGTGVAGALEIARVLSQSHYRRTAVIACWDEEERKDDHSTVGSQVYAARARQANEVVVASFVLDEIGYFSSQPGSQTTLAGLEQIFPEPMAQISENQNRGDFVLLVADSLSHRSVERFALHAQALGLETVAFELTDEQKTAPSLSDLRRSDHSSFWATDYPGIMLSDTSEFRNPHHHCKGGPDTVADLNDHFTAQIIGATLGAVVDALELQPPVAQLPNSDPGR